MTETSILPSSAPESGIDGMPPGTGMDENEGGNDRRRLMILGGIVGLLVVLAAAYLLLHKGSSSDNTPFVPHSAHTAPTNPGPAGGKTVGKPPAKGHSTGKGKTTPTKLPKKAHAPQVRDPFKALAVPPVASDTGTTTTTVGASTPTPAPSTPVQGVTPPPVVTPIDSTPPTKTTGGGSVSGAPLWIQLMNVKNDKATFKVGYAHHKFRKYIVQAPKAASVRGTVFDKVFALIGIQNGSATLQIGDDTPFDLTTGIAHTV